MNRKMTAWTALDEVRAGKFATPEDKAEKEKLIALDVGASLRYAIALNGRFPPAEVLFAQDPYYSYIYAKLIIKGRFPLGEPVISESPVYAALYAVHILKCRWREAEEVILSHPEAAIYYRKLLEIPETQPAPA